MSRAKKIALFGGSFDPIHCGHLEIARQAVETLDLDEIRFIPCRVSPHKLDHPPAPAEVRLEMLKTALTNLPWATIDDSELHEPPPSYSCKTAARIHRQEPDSRLFWLVGTDQWESLPRWREPEKLCELLEFIVVTRGATPEPRDGWRMHPIHGEHPASSSAIRDGARIGELPTDWLPQGVEELIIKHQLYRS